MLLFLLAISSPLYAVTKHALLIGINDYPVSPLEGPQFDVAAIKQSLKKNMGFKNSNIITLLNEQATKSSILSGLDDLYANTREGDQIFIYFSGHGTSASDNNFDFPLPTTTGAFVPYDVIPSGQPEEFQPRLVVGRTDLRPRLEMLDKGGRSVFVVMDACYSGNSVRGVQSTFTLTERFMNLNDALASKGIVMDWSRDFPTNKYSDSTNEYPYQNIYYMSASGEHEVALEITADRLSDYPTIDGKPHGAFTDSLLRAFNEPAKVDQNRDGNVSYAELRSSLRKQMEKRNFNHTPQGLPNLEQDKHNLNNKGVLLWANQRPSNKDSLIKKPNAAPRSSENKKTNSTEIAKLPSHNSETKLLYLAKGLILNELPTGIKLTSRSQSADYSLIALSQKEYAWVSTSGDVIRKVTSPSSIEIAEQLSFLIWRDEIKQLSETGRQPVQLELFGNGKGSTARNSESIGFSINLHKGGQLMLINADSSGQLTVLYPVNDSERNRFASNSVVTLPNFASIQPPFGQDMLLAITFTEEQSLVKRLSNTSFRFNSNNSTDLFGFLQKSNTSTWGMNYLSLITTP